MGRSREQIAPLLTKPVRFGISFCWPKVSPRTSIQGFANLSNAIFVSETEEWPAMAKGQAAIAMPTALREALREVLAFPAVDDIQKTAKSEIIKALEKGLDARRQRIVISQTSISWVRWFGLLVTGLCVMVGIAFAHLDNRRNCGIALTLFATGMAASVLIIAAHSRPFNSTVSPKRLHDIKAQYSID